MPRARNEPQSPLKRSGCMGMLEKSGGDSGGDSGGEVNDMRFSQKWVDENNGRGGGVGISTPPS